MEQRKVKPTNNKFYQTTKLGGYSWCIEGKPKDSTCNVLSNCVGYACGRFNEIIGSMKYPQLNCNAENFIERAKMLGLKISDKPTIGGIMVWQKGKTLSNKDGAGHVEVVEKIVNDNCIYTSGSDYGGKPFYYHQLTNSNGRWGKNTTYTFRGCIVNPSIKNSVSCETLSIEEIAKEVIQGKWGNGANRKEKLTKAGYDYNKVQAKVNELLKGK